MTTAEIYQPIEEHKRFAGLRSAALIEMGIFFVIALLIDLFFLDGNRYWPMEPHPFWVVVILMAVQYGTSEGVLSAVIASVILLFGNMPEMQTDQYNYWLHVFSRPLMWVVAAVIVGELRQRHIREREYLYAELREAQRREETISNSYVKVKDIKEKLELRIASQLRASVDTYRAAKAIEKNHPNDVLNGVQELVHSVLQPKKFSVYLLGSEGLDSTITYGWQADDRFAQKFDSGSQLYKEVIGGQKVLCVANADHQKVLGDQGVLAGPLIDNETGEINGMLKIEQTGFMDLNLSTIEAFHSICEWVGMAMVNARKYQDAKESSLVNPDLNLMSNGYFRQYTDYISALGKRVGFAVNMLVVQLVNAEKLSSEQRVKAARALSEASKTALRSVDMAFDYQKDGQEYSIVLPATNRAGAKIVLEKLEEELRRKMPKSVEAEFSFTIHTIHEA